MYKNSCAGKIKSTLLSMVILLTFFNPMLVVSAAGSETLSIGSTTVNRGDTVVLPISIAGVDNVTGVDVTVVYNANIVTISSIVANSSVVTGSSLTLNNDTAGKAIIVLTNNAFTTTSSVPIIDITFNVVGSSGNSLLELQEVEFSDASYNVYEPGTINNGQITIEGTNNAPVASVQSITTSEDTAADITLSATDADGDLLTYSIVGNPSHGTVNLVGNVATYTPDTNYDGSDSFIFKANDGEIDSNTATVSITVVAGNDAPVANLKGPYTGTEGDEITFDGSGSYDIDGNIVSYSWDFGDETSGSGENPTHTYSQDGTYTITLTVTDNLGAIDSNSTTVEVGKIAPIVTIHSPSAITNNSTPLLYATFDQIAVSTWYEIDGTIGTGGFNADNLTITLPELTNGQHTVRVYANNSNEKVGNASKVFNVDTIKPKLALDIITQGTVSTLYIDSSEPLFDCTVNNVKCTKTTPSNWSIILEHSENKVIVATDFAGNKAIHNVTREIGKIPETVNNRTNYTNENVILNITTTQYVDESNITICEFNENPVGSLETTTIVSLSGINTFIQINVEPRLNDSIDKVRISINYSGADLTAIDEDSLTLYVWNEITGKWIELKPGGIDKSRTIVWGELEHLSLFSILGEEATEEISPIVDTNNGGSSGGGSGGGGGSSGEDFYNILVSETDRKSVYKNSKVSYMFELDGNIVKNINFTALNSAGTIAAKVEILNHTSTLVSIQPPHEVYKNLNIWVGNYGWAVPKNMVDTKVVFTVEKSWLNENNINESSISLYHYSESTWQELKTRKISEDANSLQFEAETQRFSSFAVVGNTYLGEPGGEGIVEEPATETTPAPKATEKEGLPGFSLLVAVLVLMVAVQILRKKE
ncbi:MAG: PGF-pre-PGF domain-containing protein [Methanosarcinales archaeon]|nr:PGF-pre-PGF domain-containing protein [Methanosarcinales archaeon]